MNINNANQELKIQMIINKPRRHKYSQIKFKKYKLVYLSDLVTLWQ